MLQAEPVITESVNTTSITYSPYSNLKLMVQVELDTPWVLCKVHTSLALLVGWRSAWICEMGQYAWGLKKLYSCQTQ